MPACRAGGTPAAPGELAPRARRSGETPLPTDRRRPSWGRGPRARYPAGPHSLRPDGSPPPLPTGPWLPSPEPRAGAAERAQGPRAPERLHGVSRFLCPPVADHDSRRSSEASRADAPAFPGSSGFQALPREAASALAVESRGSYVPLGVRRERDGIGATSGTQGRGSFVRPYGADKGTTRSGGRGLCESWGASSFAGSAPGAGPEPWLRASPDPARPLGCSLLLYGSVRRR